MVCAFTLSLGIARLSVFKPLFKKPAFVCILSFLLPRFWQSINRLFFCLHYQQLIVKIFPDMKVRTKTYNPMHTTHTNWGTMRTEISNHSILYQYHRYTLSGNVYIVSLYWILHVAGCTKYMAKV